MSKRKLSIVCVLKMKKKNMYSWFVQCVAYSYNFTLQFDLMLSEDGSGRGAALVAAVSERSR